MLDEIKNIVEVVLEVDLTTAIGVAMVVSLISQLVKKTLYKKLVSKSYYKILIHISCLVISGLISFSYLLVIDNFVLIHAIENMIFGYIGAVYGYEVLKSILKLKDLINGNSIKKR